MYSFFNFILCFFLVCLWEWWKYNKIEIESRHINWRLVVVVTDLLLWSLLKFEGANIERFSNWTLAYVAGIQRGVWNSGVWECEGIGKGWLGRTTNCKLQLHNSYYFFIVTPILLLWSIKVRNCFWLNRPCKLVTRRWSTPWIIQSSYVAFYADVSVVRHATILRDWRSFRPKACHLDLSLDSTCAATVILRLLSFFRLKQRQIDIGRIDLSPGEVTSFQSTIGRNDPIPPPQQLGGAW